MSTNKYLDSTGLTYLWGKIKAEAEAQAAARAGYIKYDPSAQTITLWPSEDASKVDGATAMSTINVGDFLADGMVQNVETVVAKDVAGGITYKNETYVGEEVFIKFSFGDYDSDPDTEGVQPKVIYLKADEVGKIYTAGDGISLDNDCISVTEVKANVTKTTQAIPVAGGPLAKLFENAQIEVPDFVSGDSIENILLSLLCKEEWPTSTTPRDGAAKATISAPSFSLSNSQTTEANANKNPVEVGTKCELSNITISEAIAGIDGYSRVEGFTFGYSAEDDNTRDTDDTIINATVKSGPSLKSENYTLNVDFTNFDNKADANNITDATASNVKYSATSLIATEGVNKVKASVTGPKATVTFNAIPSKYACSNLKKTRAGVEVGQNVYHKSGEKSEQTATTTNGASNNVTKYVTAYYKYFGGYTTITDINQIDSDIVRRTTDICTGWVNFGNSNEILVKSTLTTEAGKSVLFAIPSKYGFSLKNALSGNEQIGTPSWPSREISVTTGDITTPYTVYLYPIESADGNLAAKDIKITK